MILYSLGTSFSASRPAFISLTVGKKAVSRVVGTPAGIGGRSSFFPLSWGFSGVGAVGAGSGEGAAAAGGGTGGAASAGGVAPRISAIASAHFRRHGTGAPGFIRNDPFATANLAIRCPPPTKTPNDSFP